MPDAKKPLTPDEANVKNIAALVVAGKLDAAIEVLSKVKRNAAASVFGGEPYLFHCTKCAKAVNALKPSPWKRCLRTDELNRPCHGKLIPLYAAPNLEVKG